MTTTTSQYCPMCQSKHDPSINCYELARKIGDKRFGSECKHEHVIGNKCADCQRTVKK